MAMNKKAFQQFLKSVREGARILKGKKEAARHTHIEAPDVAKIRLGLKLSQEKFARLLGISVFTLRNWEQGRRQPQGPAVVLLRIVNKYPQVLLS